MSVPATKISVIRKSQPVELEVSEGETILYYIKEMTGAERDAWLTEQSKKYTTGPDGKPSEIRDYNGIYSTLLKYCLYGPTGVKVPESVIQEWPVAAQEALHEIAANLNGIKGREEGDDAKN